MELWNQKSDYSSAYLAEASRQMAALTALTGLSVRWKRANGYWIDDLMPSEQCAHLESFCLAVKSHGANHGRCIRNDSTEMEERVMAHGGQPFCCECYAGVTELIIPIYRQSTYDGFLQFGPMRRESAKSHYPWCQEEFSQLPVYDEKTVMAATDILVVLANYWRLFELENSSRGIQHPQIKKAMEYIRTHIREAPTAPEVARHCHLSTSRFLHVFTEKAGMTFSEFTTRAKIDEAKRLLTRSNLTITQVAFAVGFSSQSYFGAVFKKQTGVTPRQYQLQELGGVAGHGI